MFICTTCFRVYSSGTLRCKGCNDALIFVDDEEYNNDKQYYDECRASYISERRQIASNNPSAVENTRPHKQKVPLQTILAIAFAVITLIFIVSKLSGSGNSSNRNIDAWVCAQNAVTESLKSPSTAKFPSYSSDYITDLGNDRYRINAYVDAQNSFGATARQYFTVTLTLTKSGYKDESVTFK